MTLVGKLAQIIGTGQFSTTPTDRDCAREIDTVFLPSDVLARVLATTTATDKAAAAMVSRTWRDAARLAAAGDPLYRKFCLASKEEDIFGPRHAAALLGLGRPMTRFKAMYASPTPANSAHDSATIACNDKSPLETAIILGYPGEVYEELSVSGERRQRYEGGPVSQLCSAVSGDKLVVAGYRTICVFNRNNGHRQKRIECPENVFDIFLGDESMTALRWRRGLTCYPVTAESTSSYQIISHSDAFVEGVRYAEWVAADSNTEMMAIANMIPMSLEGPQIPDSDDDSSSNEGNAPLSSESWVSVRRLSSGQEEHLWQTSSYVSLLAMNDQRVVAGTRNKEVYVWQLSTGAMIYSMSEGCRCFSAICLTEDRIYMASRDGTLRQYSCTDERAHLAAKKRLGSFVSALYCTGNILAVGLESLHGDGRGRIYLFHANSGQEITSLRSKQGGCVSLTLQDNFVVSVNNGAAPESSADIRSREEARAGSLFEKPLGRVETWRFEGPAQRSAWRQWFSL